jgi:hypothetical protein
MTINTMPKEAIGRLMSASFSGDLNGAIAVLNQSGLNEEQKAKIAAILKEPRSDMEHRIVVVVGEGNITSAAAPGEQAPSDILAQQYSDQPELMDLATLHPEEVTDFCERTPMTDEGSTSVSRPSKRKRFSIDLGARDVKKRKVSLENSHAEPSKSGFLVDLQKAKWEQNPDLRKQLVVIDERGFNLSNSFNGTGENELAAGQLSLRGENSVTDRAASLDTLHTEGPSLQARSYPMANELYSDVLGNIFYHIAQCDFKALASVACVNKHWNQCSINFWAGCDLKQLSPQLTILDAKTQGVECEDKPNINKPQLFKWVREMSPHVEGNAGVTQLTMTKGTTLNQLIAIAKGEGMEVVVGWDPVIEKLGDVPVEQTYDILITNSVFINSRDNEFNLQKELVEGHGCKMPTVQEYVALCVFTNKVFKKCLYGQNPMTFGRSSTHGANYPLVIGGSTSAILNIRNTCFDIRSYGAGGQRKF